jgi:hypothetical protein
MGEILECGAAHDEIESVAWQRQIGGVAFIKGDVDAGLLGVLTRHADEGAADVHADHAAAGHLGEFNGEVARAWCDLEHPIAWLDLRRKPMRRAPESLHVLGGLARVPGGDEAFHADALVPLGPPG